MYNYLLKDVYLFCDNSFAMQCKSSSLVSLQLLKTSYNKRQQKFLTTAPNKSYKNVSVTYQSPLHHQLHAHLNIRKVES